MVPFARLLCPVDFSDASRHALDHVQLDELFATPVAVACRSKPLSSKDLIVDRRPRTPAVVSAFRRTR